MRPTPRRCPCQIFCVRVMRGWLRAFRGEPDAWADMMLNSSLGCICVHADD
jgi:hypothetical protein